MTFGLAIVVQDAQGNVGDFALQHAAGRAVLAGSDPYVVAPQSWPSPYAYPPPAALVASLLEFLPSAIVKPDQRSRVAGRKFHQTGGEFPRPPRRTRIASPEQFEQSPAANLIRGL